MAEEADQEHGVAASGGVDAAAMALALGGASRPKADAFLDKQSQLVEEQMQLARIQIEDAREQRNLHLSHLRLRRFSDYSKMALEITVGLFLLVIVGGFGAMVWSAAHSNGLVIEAFSVPPDLDNRGLTGQALASQMLDKLIAMQNATQSDRPAQTNARLRPARVRS